MNQPKIHEYIYIYTHRNTNSPKLFACFSSHHSWPGFLAFAVCQLSGSGRLKTCWMQVFILSSMVIFLTPGHPVFIEEPFSVALDVERNHHWGVQQRPTNHKSSSATLLAFWCPIRLQLLTFCLVNLWEISIIASAALSTCARLDSFSLRDGLTTRLFDCVRASESRSGWFKSGPLSWTKELAKPRGKLLCASG